jgi:hypothetical protein
MEGTNAHEIQHRSSHEQFDSTQRLYERERERESKVRGRERSRVRSTRSLGSKSDQDQQLIQTRFDAILFAVIGVQT